jgi:exoribonuclease-2
MRAREHDRTDLQRIARRAMIEKGFLPEFSKEVNAELATLEAMSFDDDKSVRDLRAKPWCSIDNDDSRDLDQLTVAESLDGGKVKILVAVADVDALVSKGTAIDRHAATNTTSVYTAAAIFPMLPTKLSTDLTSLNQGADRIAMVMELELSSEGEIVGERVYRAWVNNKAKLAYDGVAAWIDGSGPMPEQLASAPGVGDNLKIQDQFAQKLRAHRHEHGALELESLEARPVFEGDAVTDLKIDRRSRAKELIEDFMIAANGVTARFLEAKGYTSLRRVVRTPKRWDRIVSVAAEHGWKLPATPDAPALEAFLVARKKADPLRFPDLSLIIVKLMGAGEYAIERPGQEAIGHFGLAVRDYAHSTAPNRRFPDLITHRLLKAAMRGAKAPYTPEELESLAAHCTEQEDDASKIERQVRKSAGALLLESRIGERFEGVVTGASDKGTWVRVFHPAVEGKIVEGAEGLDVGQQVKVRLLETNVERGFIDFARA